MRLRIPVLGALATVLTLPMAGTAVATHVACGSVITTNTVLDSDVGPCPQGGVVVGADNITLDLNGHRIFGVVGVPADGVGVMLTGRTGVTVKNGTITDFDAGVALVAGGGNTVTGITARDNISALGVGDWGDGIAMNNSIDNVITNNNVIHNGPFDGIGLFGVSKGNTISGNLVKDNNIESGPTTNQDDGIRLEPNTSNNTVTGNTVEGSGLEGIAIFASSTGNTVTNNVVRDNGFHDKNQQRRGDGIRAFQTGNTNTIQGNSVFGNAASGIRIDSQLNQILTNTTGGNDAAPDVHILLADLVVVEATVRVVLTLASNTVDTHVPPRNAAFDLYDTNPACGLNTWSGNTYGTAFPPCTTV